MKYVLSIITISKEFNHEFISTLNSIRIISSLFSIQSILVISRDDEKHQLISKKIENIVTWDFELLVGKDNSIFNAMNIGLSMAEGNYLWFLNAGDLAIYNDELLQIVSSRFDYHSFPVINDYLGKRYLRCANNNGAPHQGFLIRKEIAKHYPFKEGLISSDHLQIISVRGNCTGFYHEKPICIFDFNGITSIPQLSNYKFIINETLSFKIKFFSKLIFKNIFGSQFYFFFINKIINGRHLI
jgi:hypothetical protein